MSIICPNTNHPDWQAIESKYGNKAAWAVYLANGEEIPSLAQVEQFLKDRDKLPVEKEVAPAPKNSEYGNDISDNQILQNTEFNKVNFLEGRQFESLELPTEVEERDNGVEHTPVTEQDKINEVNEIITKQLKEVGVGIGVLTEFQESHGMLDPKGARNTATGLVELIKLAKGEKGAKSLPEEFAHFVDAVLRQQDHNLYKRLMDMLNNPDHIKEILDMDGKYEDYLHQHKNDPTLMAREARAKLLAKHLLHGEQIESDKPWANLLRRVKDLFRRLFSRMSGRAIQYSMSEIDAAYNRFSIELLGGEVNLDFKLDALRDEPVMHNLKENISKLETSIDVLMDAKAHEAYKGKQTGRMSLKDQQAIHWEISSLDRLKDQGRSKQGIAEGAKSLYLEFVEVMDAVSKIKDKRETDPIKANEVARVLRKQKEFVDGYRPFVESLNSYIRSNEYEQGSDEVFEDMVKNLNHIINTAETEYYDASRPIFQAFITQFSGSLLGTVNSKGEVFTEKMFTDLFTTINKDINIWDLWVNSMSNASELMLRLIEQPIKWRRDAQRKQVQIYQRDMMYAQEQLEKAGHKTDFMYQRDNDGKLTGYLYNKLDNASYQIAYQENLQHLHKIYGSPKDANMSDANREAYRSRVKQWVKANTEADGRTPLQSKYGSAEWNSWTKAQQDFYDTIMAIKDELDKMLPAHKVEELLAPQIRKDLWNIARDTRGPVDAARKYGRLLGDQFLYRESDDQFGALKEVDVLPTYYTTKLEDMDQLSTDIVSTMGLYANTAVGYHMMNEIIDIMELGRDVLSDRYLSPDAKQTKSGRVINKFVAKPSEVANMVKRLDEFFDNQVYGKTSKHAGFITIPKTGKKISLAKVAGELNKYTAMSTYAFNLLGGAANLITGEAMTRIETLAGEHFGVKESATATNIYRQWLPDIIADLGRRRDKTLPSLIIERFNVLQDYESSIRSVRANTRNLLLRAMTGSTAFFLNNAGEHFIATKLFLAMAERHMLKDASGNEIKLIDAFEVAKDAKGMEYLKTKKGVTNIDGSAFTENDIMRFSRKYAKVHQNLNGIYNREDMNVLQTYALGQMAMMFRKWIPPAIHRRFSKEQFDFDMDDYHTGYYRAFGNFMFELAKDLTNLKVQIPMHWDALGKRGQADVKRALTEIGYILAMMGAFLFLHSAWGLGWKDDDEWIKNFTMYQLRRQVTEVGVMVPGPWQVSEALELVKSPAAAVNYADNLLGILKVQDVFREPLQSGPYKGYNRYVRNVVRTIPYYNPIKRAFHPAESLKGYTN